MHFWAQYDRIATEDGNGGDRVAYSKTVLKEALRVEDVISIHYFEYAKDFAFSGEMHDFWELVYADKGEPYVTADTEEFVLHPGELYLHTPMEFHNIRCNGHQAADAVILSFSPSCPELHRIAGRRLLCAEEERSLLAQIIAEAKLAFSTPLGDPFTEKLIRKEEQVFGCEQMIRLYLEWLLITLVRRHGEEPAKPPKLPTRMDSRLQEICQYLEAHVEDRLTFEDVCSHFSLSASAMKKLFRGKMGCGLMEFYSQCRINRAKLLIREKNLNFTEIAQKLGYASLPYFSRRFKQMTDLTPSEYEASVQFYLPDPEALDEKGDAVH